MCVGDIPDGIWSILFKWETMLCTRPDTSEVCNQEFHLEGGESLGNVVFRSRCGANTSKAHPTWS
jgi:hypothetical protein